MTRQFTTTVTTVDRIRYFAYGSNMLGSQMAERCPGANNPVEAVLDGYTWVCNDRGVATVVPVEGRLVHGILWEVTDDHIITLDGYEGVDSGHYRREMIEVELTGSGEVVDAVIYIAGSTEPGPPRDGYMDKVLGGAAEHGLPEWWLTYLRGWNRAGRPPRAQAGSDAAPQTLTELFSMPGVTESVDVRSRFGFMAIHGGELEVMTDVIAEMAAKAAGASYYGVHHPSEIDHHLPSTRFRSEESPRLAEFLDHVDVVVSIHGYGRRGRWTDVMTGGTNRQLAAHVSANVNEKLNGFDLITDLDEIPAGLRGLHSDNPVNRPDHGGVQLELPPRLRGLSPLSPPPGEDGLSPPTRRLIEGLAAAARTWDGLS